MRILNTVTFEFKSNNGQRKPSLKAEKATATVCKKFSKLREYIMWKKSKYSGKKSIF